MLVLAALVPYLTIHTIPYHVIPCHTMSSMKEKDVTEFTRESRKNSISWSGGAWSARREHAACRQHAAQFRMLTVTVQCAGIPISHLLCLLVVQWTSILLSLLPEYAIKKSICPLPRHGFCGVDILQLSSAFGVKFTRLQREVGRQRDGELQGITA
jgi:hypothetical protein